MFYVPSFSYRYVICWCGICTDMDVCVFMALLLVSAMGVGSLNTVCAVTVLYQGSGAGVW